VANTLVTWEAGLAGRTHIDTIAEQKWTKKWGETAVGRLAPMDYRLVTFAACRPLGPEVTSNSTAWPSFSDLYPSA